MSRSIHETAGDWQREARYRDSNREHKLERLRAISDALNRKRAIKKAARRARKISLPPAPVNPDAIPVDILADHEAVKHPASVEDIRAVLRRLPLGTLDGLSGIRLCAADRGIDALEILEAFSFWEERDPLIGRFPLDDDFGVWRWPLLGLYEADSCRVEVYGCVYDSSLLPEHDLRLFVLKVETLYVLLHEIAHHVQHLSRFIQGAPQTKKTARQEYTADEFVMRNFEQAVLPVLQEAYADDRSRRSPHVYVPGDKQRPASGARVGMN